MNTITKVNNLLLIEIDDFLSDTEIDKILNTRKQSFEKAITHYPNYYRNNDRIVENNIVLSSYLFRKLKHLKIPCIVTKITGINDKIRFCRYQKDQLFSKHQDGVYYPNSTYESKFTFLLYLNDNTCFDYGETMFYKSKTDNQPVKTILPRKGKLLIFDHKIWHTGAKVTKGNKYILRSDIFIKSSNQKSYHHQGYIWDLLKLNKKEFLSCGRDKKIKRWNTNLTLLSTMEFHSKSIFKMIHFQNNEFISCSRDFTIKKWNTLGEVLSSIRLKEMILNLVCFQNNLIIAAGTSGKIYLLDTTLTLIKTIQVHHHWIWGLSIMGNKIISCCEDGNICITDMFSKTKASRIVYKYDQPLFCLNTEKNDLILAGSKDGTLIEFSTITKKITRTKVHSDIIRSIIYHNQKNIITCGDDNKVISIDRISKKTKEILVANNFLQDIIIIKDKLYAAGYDGVILHHQL